MKQKVKIISILLLIFYLASLFFRFPHGDEAILAEQSYWLQKIGYVKSEMFTGFGFGWEIIQYHYHKLFILVGAIFIKVFGVSVTALRLNVLFAFCILYYFIFRYFKMNFDNKEKLILYFNVFFILSIIQYHLFYYSFIFRPEIQVICCGFISFYFLSKFIKEEKQSDVILSGVFAGLSLLFHLNGLVFVFAGMFFLIYKSKRIESVYFVITSILISLFYFFNIHSTQEFNNFLYQFTNDPNLHKEDFSVLLKLNKIITEHKRYFHSPKEIVLSLLFLFVLITNFKSITLKASYKKDLFIYTLVVMLFLAIFAHDKTDKYSILFIPFWLMLITISIFDLLNLGKDKVTNKSKLIKYTFALFLVLYFLTNIIVINKNILVDDNTISNNKKMSDFIIKNNGNDIYKSVNKLDSNYSNKDNRITICARENFFFNEYKNFKIISLLSFEYYWKFNSKNKELTQVNNQLNNQVKAEVQNDKKADKQDFYKFSQMNNVEYIWIENIKINSNFLELVKFEDYKWGNVYYNYKVILLDKNNVILKLNN